MTKTILLVATLLFSNANNPEPPRWGQTGHRTVGHIATQLLSDEANAHLKEILHGNSLAEVSTWMDEIKSDNNFRYMSPWHYCTIPEGKTYEEAGTPEEGDVIWAINKSIAALKEGGLTPEEEEINVKILVHLIGDLHQPLHVGNGTDRGGNDARVTWFGQNSNLHRVWDSEMIDGKQLSFTELADFIDDQLDEETINKWQSTSVLEWAYESHEMLPEVYEYPDSGRLGYEYSFYNWDKVELRLLQAGVRLAGVFNDIYSD